MVSLVGGVNKDDGYAGCVFSVDLCGYGSYRMVEFRDLVVGLPIE